MKKTLMIFAGLLFFSLATVKTASAQAEIAKFPTTWFAFICNGDFVEFNDEAKVVYHLRFDEAGGAHLTQNYLFHSKATSSFGNDYIIKVNDNLSVNVKVGEVYTSVFNGMAIGQGDAPNLKVKILYHYTFNANWELTAFTEMEVETCK